MFLKAQSKKTGFIGGLFVCIALLYWFFWVRGIETTDNAYIKGNITILSPKIMGYVTNILVEDNQVVAANMPLIQIDDRDYQARVQQASAILTAAKAKLDGLYREKELEGARKRQAQSSINAAQALLERATKDFKRSNKLVKDGAISQQFLDASTSEQKNAESTLQKSQAELDVMISQMAITDAQIIETKAQIDNATAALTLAQLDLDHTVIKAPIDGYMANRAVQVGQLARPGMAVASIVPQRDLWVEANYKETQIENMKPGQNVQIMVDGYSSLSFSGKIDSLSPASGSEFSLLPPENATGNFTKIVRRIPVKIVFDASPDLTKLKPGMSVLVKVNTRS